MIDPPLALLVMLVVVDYLPESLALGVVVAGLALHCWHLPTPTDGSPEVKAFAREARPVLTPDDTVYAIRPTCAQEGPSLTAGALLVTDRNIRTALVFYMDRPLLCIAEGQVLTGAGFHNAYAIADAESWPRVSHLGEVVVQALDGGAGYLLARLK